MCGIYFIENNNSSLNIRNYLNILKRRGPNCSKISNVLNCEFGAYVLWQQGAKPFQQPCVDENEQHILIFNGDIFSTRDNMNESDTEWLFKQLKSCNNDQDYLHLFQNIQGPFAFIYLNVENNLLWFGRDSLGRNSLLLSKSEHNGLILSSTLSKTLKEYNSVIELPALGIFNYKINLDSKTHEINLYPWVDLLKSDIQSVQLNQIEHTMGMRCTIKSTINPPWLRYSGSSYDYNFEELVENTSVGVEVFQFLLNNIIISSICDEVINLLKYSVKERVITTPNMCKNCIMLEKCDHPRIGILFSGGIDCTIIALLADLFIPTSTSIDLINVAFEKFKTQTVNYDVPDRLSAISSLNELQLLVPNRKWNLVEVNVTRKELESELESRISDLIYPLNTILDESLGAALWFAARGIGTVNGEIYVSPCRVLLLGSGADELFGGYTRHRNAFLRESKQDNSVTLESELEYDFQRLPFRNLARDDRVICDHGVTPRTPFLQENFIHFIRNLKPLQKCYHKLQQGIGDKLLLRLCGYKLGLRDCTHLKKRAIQFGSRIAIAKQNAMDVSKYLE